MSTEEIFNFRRVSDRVITGGHPKAQQLRDAAAEGLTAVVNLAPVDDRSLPDEGALVHSLGMSYHYLPVDWSAPSIVDFEAFAQIMQPLESQRVLIHCAANFRVTAFYSLYAQQHLGWSPAQGAALRASVWDGSDFPVWQAFIHLVEQQL
jgi:protein tyrosine phosphatase (PTP) superfamily phosphohydrolase (DUF442 family)